jgi:signal transduction histidine kinase
VRFDHGNDEIVTDAERLRQALINLLANARQAVRDGSATDTDTRGGAGPGGSRDAPIDLSTTSGPEGAVLIAIRDRGPGMAPDVVPRIFDPFFTTKRTGTGIGLAITRNIVDGLGGSIRVRSRLGEGTEMIVELPRVASSPPDTNAP